MHLAHSGSAPTRLRRFTYAPSMGGNPVTSLRRLTYALLRGDCADQPPLRWITINTFPEAVAPHTAYTLRTCLLAILQYTAGGTGKDYKVVLASDDCRERQPVVIRPGAPFCVCVRKGGPAGTPRSCPHMCTTYVGPFG